MILENAVEVNAKAKTTSDLGRILLKGENIVLVRALDDAKH